MRFVAALIIAMLSLSAAHAAEQDHGTWSTFCWVADWGDPPCHISKEMRSDKDEMVRLTFSRNRKGETVLHVQVPSTQSDVASGDLTFKVDALELLHIVNPVCEEGECTYSQSLAAQDLEKILAGDVVMLRDPVAKQKRLWYGLDLSGLREALTSADQKLKLLHP